MGESGLLVESRVGSGRHAASAQRPGWEHSWDHKLGKASGPGCMLTESFDQGWHKVLVLRAEPVAALGNQGIIRVQASRLHPK